MSPPQLRLPHLRDLPRQDTARGAALLKQEVDSLERNATRLGEEAVDDGYEGGVQDREDDVELPANVGDARRRDFDNNEVADPNVCGLVWVTIVGTE